MSVICPYLLGEKRQQIFCRGPEQGLFVNLGFASSTDCRKYQQEYCRGDYTRCLLAQAIDPAWGLIAKCVCPYNNAIDCKDQNRCAQCGWNPQKEQLP